MELTGSNSKQANAKQCAPLLLSLSIQSMEGLQRAFLPIIDGCGLFVPLSSACDQDQSRTLKLGQELFLLLDLAPVDLQDAFIARIVWIKGPVNTSQPEAAGVAVQLLESGKRLRTLLENHLGTRPGDSQAPYIL